MNPIPGFPSYFAGPDGRIFSARVFPPSRRHPLGRTVSRELKGCLVVSPKGYRFVQVDVVNEDGKHRSVALYRLICSAFHGPCPCGFQASHLNGNSLDCRASNLAWESPKANNARKHEHGTAQVADAAGHVKLTWDEVREIRRLFQEGASKVALAKSFGVTRTSVHWIVTNRQWREQVAS